MLVRRGIAPIGMKSLGGDGRQVKEKVVTAEEALRYAMSLPVATTVSGIDSMQVLRQNLRVAQGFRPMSKRQMDALRKRVRKEAEDGRYELYKTTATHDGQGRTEAAWLSRATRNWPRKSTPNWGEKCCTSKCSNSTPLPVHDPL